jgi:MFS family permease
VLLFNFWAWLFLRFATGMALSGLYMIVESWLTDISPRDRRGTVLSIYLAISLIGMALGQLPLMFLPASDPRLFILAAVMLSLAIIPIGLTRVSSPHPIPAVRVTPFTLMRASRVAVVSAGFAGMVIGAFWTLGPVVGGAFGLGSGQVGLLMALGVLAGASSQVPIGRASDLIDRRLVIGAVAVIGGGVSVFGTLFAEAGALMLFTAVALLCAAVMPMYPLCIALASDKTELSLVEVTGGMLLAHSMGSIVGPMIVAPAMASAGPEMFFVFSAVCMALIALWTFYRYFVAERPAKYEPHRPMLPRTSQVVAELLSDEGATSGRPRL